MNLNNTQGNVILNNVGLSDTRRTAKLYTYDELDFGFTSMKKHWIGRFHVEYCKFLKLDEYIRDSKVKKVDFIKCDVEGAEYLVFRGGENTLRKFTPIILFEVVRDFCSDFGYTPEEMFAYLKKFGYTFYAFDNQRLVPVSEQLLSFLLGNCFAVAKTKEKIFLQSLKGYIE